MGPQAQLHDELRLGYEGGRRFPVLKMESEVSESREESESGATAARCREFTCQEEGLEAQRMPVYVYQCQVCGGEQELLHGITNKPKRRLHCEKCGKRTPVVRRITTLGGSPTGKVKPPAL